jgi:hypothetical protein
MRRRCNSSPAPGRPCSGNPECCRDRSARRLDNASRQRKTRLVSAPMNRCAYCRSGPRRRTRQG